MSEKFVCKVLKWFRHMERISGYPLTRGVYESDVVIEGILSSWPTFSFSGCLSLFCSHS